MADSLAPDLDVFYVHLVDLRHHLGLLLAALYLWLRSGSVVRTSESR